MEAPSHGSPAIEIALRQTAVGERPFEPGDRFDTADFLSRGELNERNVDILRRHKFIGPLTPDTYKNAVARRPPGTIGRGFTPAFLREMGVELDDGPTAPAKAAPKPKAAEPAKERKAFEPVDTEYKGRIIRQVEQGRFRPYEVWNKEGELLRPSRFKKMDSAKVFIDGLPPIEAAADPAANAGREANDGEHVQPGSVDDHLEGTSENR